MKSILRLSIHLNKQKIIGTVINSSSVYAHRGQSRLFMRSLLISKATDTINIIQGIKSMTPPFDASIQNKINNIHPSYVKHFPEIVQWLPEAPCLDFASTLKMMPPFSTSLSPADVQKLFNSVDNYIQTNSNASDIVNILQSLGDIMNSGHLSDSQKNIVLKIMEKYFQIDSNLKTPDLHLSFLLTLPKLDQNFRKFNSELRREMSLTIFEIIKHQQFDQNQLMKTFTVLTDIQIYFNDIPKKSREILLPVIQEELAARVQNSSSREFTDFLRILGKARFPVKETCSLAVNDQIKAKFVQALSEVREEKLVPRIFLQLLPAMAKVGFTYKDTKYEDLNEVFSFLARDWSSYSSREHILAISGFVNLGLQYPQITKPLRDIMIDEFIASIRDGTCWSKNAFLTLLESLDYHWRKNQTLLFLIYQDLSDIIEDGKLPETDLNSTKNNKNEMKEAAADVADMIYKFGSDLQQPIHTIPRETRDSCMKLIEKHAKYFNVRDLTSVLHGLGKIEAVFYKFPKEVREALYTAICNDFPGDTGYASQLFYGLGEIDVAWNFLPKTVHSALKKRLFETNSTKLTPLEFVNIVRGFTIMTFDSSFQNPSHSPDILLDIHKWILDQYFNKNFKDKIRDLSDLTKFYLYYEFFHRLLPQSIQKNLLSSISIHQFPKPYIIPTTSSIDSTGGKNPDGSSTTNNKKTNELTHGQSYLRELIRTKTMQFLQECKDAKLSNIPTVQLRYNANGLSTPIFIVNLVMILNQTKLVGIFNFDHAKSHILIKYKAEDKSNKKNKKNQKNKSQKEQKNPSGQLDKDTPAAATTDGTAATAAGSVGEDSFDETVYNFDKSLSSPSITQLKLRRVLKLKESLYRQAYPMASYHPIIFFGQGDERFNEGVREIMKIIKKLIKQEIKKKKQ